MTKAELIKKIARYNGVPDSEARIFFEVFLRKLESHLNLKQSFEVPGVGYFELKRDYKSQEPVLNVIHFSEHKESEEKLFFYIPEEAEQYNSLDSYFSFSFGKPVIPLEGVKSNEFFIPHSRVEYEKLLESKVENLLAGTETKETEESLKHQLLTDKEFHKPVKKEINWKSIPSSLSGRAEHEFKEQNQEQDSVSWDFGESFGNETEDDSNKPAQVAIQELNNKNIYAISDNSEKLEEKEEIADNPLEDSIGIIEQTEQIQQLKYEATYEAEKPSLGIDNINEAIESNEYSPSNLEEIKPALFPIDDYEKIEPLIASSLKEEEEYMSEEKKPLSRDEDSPEEKENIVDEEGYTRVIPQIASLLRTKENEKRGKLESSISVNDIPSEENISDENTFDKEEIEETTDFAGEITRRRPGRSLIIVSILALVVIAGGIYLYNYFFAGKSLDSKNIPPIKRDKSHAVIIERSYDYPVTYPYNKNTIVGLFDGINPNLIKTANVEKQKQGSSNIPEAGTYEARPSKLVKGYIYQYDGFYAVQVSSWKSLSIAQTEVLKYKNGGLNAFIEEAEVKGSTYYRVRVGFKTLEEVEAYLAK